MFIPLTLPQEILTFDPFDGFNTDPYTYQLYRLTEILGRIDRDNAVVTITYIEQPPVPLTIALWQYSGTNVTLICLPTINYRMAARLPQTNTSVVLIDPATGMPTITPNVVTVAGQGVYTPTIQPQVILLLILIMAFTSDPTPIPYVLMETLTGLTDPAIVTIDYYQVPPIANDDSSLGNTVVTMQP